jgi:putative transposase
MTHVRTSPYYPQSNGKLERWRKSLKSECIRPGTPLNKQVAQRLIHSYVEHYNNVRLAQRPRVRDTDGNAGGPADRDSPTRDRKLEEARRQRQVRRQQAA